MGLGDILKRTAIAGTTLLITSVIASDSDATPAPTYTGDTGRAAISAGVNGSIDSVVEDEAPKERYRVAYAGTGNAYVPRSLAFTGNDLIVTVSPRDRTRNSLWSIVMNYCNTDALKRFYGVRNGDINDAIRGLAKYNGIQRISSVHKGQRIKIPKTLLKDGLNQDADRTPKSSRVRSMRRTRSKARTTRSARKARARSMRDQGWKSPFGGTTNPEKHWCYDIFPANQGAGMRRMCPFDRYGASRGGGYRRHTGLDLYARVGTALRPIKPGRVIEVRKKGRRGYIHAALSGVERMKGGIGLAVKIRTRQGRDYAYLHMDSVNVNLGDLVGYDTKVGTVGLSGNPYRQNPHVHITVYKPKHLRRNKGDKTEDPRRYLRFLK